jgi:hypothetical protein
MLPLHHDNLLQYSVEPHNRAAYMRLPRTVTHADQLDGRTGACASCNQ